MSVAATKILMGSGATEATDDDFSSVTGLYHFCLLYTSPSPRDRTRSRMPSSA